MNLNEHDREFSLLKEKNSFFQKKKKVLSSRHLCYPEFITKKLENNYVVQQWGYASDYVVLHSIHITYCV